VPCRLLCLLCLPLLILLQPVPCRLLCLLCLPLLPLALLLGALLRGRLPLLLPRPLALRRRPAPKVLGAHGGVLLVVLIAGRAQVSLPVTRVPQPAVGIRLGAVCAGAGWRTPQGALRRRGGAPCKVGGVLAGGGGRLGQPIRPILLRPLRRSLGGWRLPLLRLLRSPRLLGDAEQRAQRVVPRRRAVPLLRQEGEGVPPLQPQQVHQLAHVLPLRRGGRGGRAPKER
jgi:hypothetical protein